MYLRLHMVTCLPELKIIEGVSQSLKMHSELCLCPQGLIFVLL